jgi:hypothetical protein
MPIWRHSEMETFVASGTYSEPCVVRIDGDRIRVEYDDGERIAYTGVDEGAGHYRLTCPERNGRGSLHRFPDEDELVGSFVHGGGFGLWRILLRGEE